MRGRSTDRDRPSRSRPAASPARGRAFVAGRPPAVTPWKTVSVAATSCLDANAASTTAIVLGDAAAAWLEERGLPARLAAEDGRVMTVNGWPEEVP